MGLMYGTALILSWTPPNSLPGRLGLRCDYRHPPRLIMPADRLVAAIRQDLAPRAPAMIVTIYGDVVMPHGGVLGMAQLIELSERLGFSETLIRTAVSRLVSSGRLAGERRGRRSYYRLTEAAHREFAAVERQLYAPPPRTENWAIRLAPGRSEEAMRDEHLARLAGDLFLGPISSGGAGNGELVFEIASVSDTAQLADLARSLWPLDELAAGYGAMIRRFAPIAERVADLDATGALLLRLLLVHDFRLLLLRDPDLPGDGLPPDWPGVRARTLFDSLHRSLSPLAERAVAALFADPERANVEISGSGRATIYGR